MQIPFRGRRTDDVPADIVALSLTRTLWGERKLVDETAILVQVDFERDTVERFNLSPTHTHD